MSGYIGNIPVPQATQHRESFTATASQTTFNTAGYTPNFLDVFLNGVHLLNGTDYTATNGSDVVLTTGAAASDVVEVISYSTFEVANETFTGTTTTDNLTVTGAFTSLGIDDNATSTAMTLDASGNLLVGKTTTNTIDTVGHDITDHGEVMHTTDGGTTMYLNRKTSDGTIIDFRKNGTTVGSIGVSTAGVSDLNLNVISGDVGLRFRPNDDSIVPINGSGSFRDNAIDLGLSNARFKDLYLSSGVYLGGTGAANLLDDYETGTWTPTVSVGSITPLKATYVKVGKMVTVQANLNDITDTTSTSDVQITGLPFTSSASPQNQSVGSVMFRYLSRTNASQLTPLVSNDSTAMFFYWSFTNGATWDGLQYADATTGPWDLIITMTYEAA